MMEDVITRRNKIIFELMLKKHGENQRLYDCLFDVCENSAKDDFKWLLETFPNRSKKLVCIRLSFFLIDVHFAHFLHKSL